MPAQPAHLLATLCLTLSLNAAALHADPLKLKTAQGKVEGTLTPGVRALSPGARALSPGVKVRAFKGIPYAAPPVGNLRWQAPQPALHRDATLEAKDYGHHCIQTNPFPDMVFHDAGQSEDCLTLNIWTPADAKPGTGLPVMLWVHGGGFTAGGASEGRHDGTSLARHGVVVVTINYRLGIFGFFVHPQLTAESPHHASGNYGLLDQAAALAWTKDNIRNFGGDPANITVFGESAGSFSVSSLMASPLAKNNMARAIGESGGAFSSTSLTYPPLARAEQQDAAFAQAAFGTSDLAALRKLSVDQLLAGVNAKTVKPSPRLGPDIDGYFFPKPVAALYAAGEQAHIPLLAGWNADEIRTAVTSNPVKPTPESFAAQARKNYGDDAPALLAVYPATTDAEALHSAGDLISDNFIAFSTWKWLEAQVATGQAPVYRYRFDLGAPDDKFHNGNPGAFHSDDIEYVFGTLDARNTAVWRPEDRALSDQIQQYWTNFARTGNPNAGTLPTWPPYNPPAWNVMHLDATSAAKPDTQRARFQFLAAHPLKPPTD
jgi:para-nitrobenzyl esterase